MPMRCDGGHAAMVIHLIGDEAGEKSPQLLSATMQRVSTVTAITYFNTAKPSTQFHLRDIFFI